VTIIVSFIKYGLDFDFIEKLSSWMIENPGMGAFYISLLYIFGIPLAFPGGLIVFFGSYAFSHMFGFYSILS